MGWVGCVCAGVYLSIFSPPGPSRPAILTRDRSAHELYYAGVGRDLEAREFFWAEPDLKCCF
jgi:hypothetical protein